MSLGEKIENSKKILRLAAEMSKEYYGKPMIVTYSGGKDSDVLLHLAETTLKPDEFEVLNSHTSVDAPETVYHIREVFDRLREQDIEANIRYATDKDGKRITMWNLITQKKIPPTRLSRYCCQVLKEAGTPNRMAVLGVRAAESTNRQGRDVFGVRGETYSEAKFFSLDHTEEVHYEAKDRDPVWDCTLIRIMREHGDSVVNPIYDWDDSDVWEYIQKENIEVNSLYQRGYYRVGCIGCPLATYKQKIKEFTDYPKYKDAYIRAFSRMLKAREASGKKTNEKNIKDGAWTDGQAVFDWWTQEYQHKCRGQMEWDFIEEE